MENDRIAKGVYVGVCVGCQLVGQLCRKWIDSVNECLKKICLNVGQERKMVYDMNEWWEFVKGNAWGIAGGKNP